MGGASDARQIFIHRFHLFLGAKPSLETTYFTHSLTESLTDRQKVSLLIFLFEFLIYILRNASPLLFSLEIFFIPMGIYKTTSLNRMITHQPLAFSLKSVLKGNTENSDKIIRKVLSDNSLTFSNEPCEISIKIH